MFFLIIIIDMYGEATNIAHLSLLFSVEYNKKETNLKTCAQHYTLKSKMKNISRSQAILIWSAQPLVLSYQK